MKRLGAILVTVALIVGLVGCPAGPQYSLTISSTAGGSVTTPGEGTFTFEQGTAGNLEATPDAGFRFVEWTGDVGTIADVHSRTTTIAMNVDCWITANFVAVRGLIVTSSAGGSVTTPGEGAFVYDLGAVVEVMAAADEGYRFVGWTGDVGTIADCSTASTTLTINGDYSITANFERTPTKGAWIDEVLITRETSTASGVQRLKNNSLDILESYRLVDPALRDEVLADPNLTLVEGVSHYHDFTFNPVGPLFPGTGKLNPFSVPEFREAMHWLIDRDYIAQVICGGLAIPRYTCLNGEFADAKERYPDLMEAVETEYVHDPGKAASVIRQKMEMLGAVLEDGKWMYTGELVELIFLIRTEDWRKEMGDYFADLLEGLGFSVVRQYGTRDELAELWVWGDPAQGKWHIYTGGWAARAMIGRDQGDYFSFFYTKLGATAPSVLASPLWQAYVNDPVFYEAGRKLWDADYASVEERRQLFAICLTESMKDNVRMFLVTHKWFTPMRANVRVAHDLASGVSDSWMWALTAHFVDDTGEPVIGGTLRVAMPDILANPWNPVAGTNWVYDWLSIRATGDLGLWPDTRNGLRWPGRIERAEITAQTGTAIGVTNTDWCSLTFVPEIQVPLDAWAEWDATAQKFLTVQDRFGSGATTARTKSVSYYPRDIFDVPLHDGSTLSVGDFVLYTILTFDRAKEQSAIYDESTVPPFNAFISQFKGMKFITDNPDYGLIVEYYSDQWQVDAELMVTTMFPHYSQGPGMWHTVALGIWAEEDGALAFSQAKSSALDVGWMSFISGPSLPILESYLDISKTTNRIPYAPTMGLYVIQAEASERWCNLEEWYANKGHFWVGSGPFYLESADTIAKVIHLKRFEDYPDPMDKWLFLLEPLP